MAECKFGRSREPASAVGGRATNLKTLYTCPETQARSPFFLFHGSCLDETLFGSGSDGRRRGVLSHTAPLILLVPIRYGIC